MAREPSQRQGTSRKSEISPIVVVVFSVALSVVCFVLAVPIAIGTLVRDKLHIRKNLDFEWGLLGRIASTVCFCLGSVVLLAGFLVVFGILTTSLRSSFIAQIVLVPFFFSSWKLARLALRLRSLTAEATLKTDQRPPILYLRRFMSDEDSELRPFLPSWWGPLRKRRIEERDTEFLKSLGPVLALSRPGERLPPLGASRVRFNDTDWRTKVAKLMQKSQLIVFQAGLSDGLIWEMKQAFGLEPFKPILVCISREENAVTNKQQRYESFRRTLAREFPSIASILPQYLGLASYFLFLDSGKTIAFNTPTEDFPLGVLEYLHPGMSDEVKRQTKKKLKILGGCCATVALLYIVGLVVYMTHRVPW